MKYSNAEIKNVYELNPKLKIIIQNLKIKEEENQTGLTGLSKGIFLYGIAGSGKTYALYSIAKALSSRGLKCTNIENWVEFLYEIRDRYSNNQGIKYILDSLMEKDYIFIDDIGAENQTQNSQELLYLILDRANRYEKKLFISTNLSLEEFAKKYGDRLMSRIAELCISYEMISEDLRLK